MHRKRSIASVYGGRDAIAAPGGAALDRGAVANIIAAGLPLEGAGTEACGREAIAATRGALPNIIAAGLFEGVLCEEEDVGAGACGRGAIAAPLNREALPNTIAAGFVVDCSDSIFFSSTFRLSGAFNADWDGSDAAERATAGREARLNIIAAGFAVPTSAEADCSLRSWSDCL